MFKDSACFRVHLSNLLKATKKISSMYWNKTLKIWVQLNRWQAARKKQDHNANKFQLICSVWIYSFPYYGLSFWNTWIIWSFFNFLDTKLTYLKLRGSSKIPPFPVMRMHMIVSPKPLKHYLGYWSKYCTVILINLYRDFNLEHDPIPAWNLAQSWKLS